MNVVASIYHSRPELLAKLLRERGVARFLIAPDGFGKTTLAYAYADVVFSFEHVFWINGRSPCFLRDLDAGVLAAGIRQVDEAVSLVVFEDIPRLDDGRADAFSGLLADLLESGCEVLVTCAPSCDAYGSRHQDRLTLRAREFLLNEEEMRIALRGERAEELSPILAKPAERIACLCWKEGGAKDLVAGIGRESLPSDILLAMFTLSLFGRGDLRDLLPILPVSRRRLAEIARELEEGYPFLGVVSEEEAFDAAILGVGDLKVAVESSMESLVLSSSFKDKETLVARLADALVVRGMHERAVDLVMRFSTKVAASSWLARQGWSLIANGSALSARNLFDESSRGVMKGRSSCNVIAAWASHILNDPISATAFAKRTAFRSSANSPERALACVLLMRDASGSCSEQARETLEAMRKASSLPAIIGEIGNPADEDVCSLRSEGVERFVNVDLLSGLVLAFRKGLLQGMSAWEDAFRKYEGEGFGELQLATESALLLSASWMFEALAGDERLGLGLLFGEQDLASALDLHADLETVAMHAAGFTVDSLKRSRQIGEQPGWCCYCAARQLEQASNSLSSLAPYAASSRLMPHLLNFETYICAQREDFRKQCALRDRQLGEYFETHPNVFRNEDRTPRATNSNARRLAPTMHVTLFGGLEVRLGDELIASEELKRRKVRALLAILVLARGREVSRDKLAETLWPHSNMKAARKNLYTTWTTLVRLLTRNGSCPYLVREHQGCRVNPQLVTSDVSDFEALCRTLMLDSSKEFNWEQVYALLEKAYSDDLMPSEVDIEYIVSVRDRFRSQLVDALLSAAQRLLSAGETQGALWFAREALERDQIREDVYLVLMEAQIAASQRGAAIESYFTCKKMLSERLGIDPSAKLASLYRRVLESEESFV